ncbi:MAG: sulfatase [Thermoanaerobaculales bacterium]
MRFMRIAAMIAVPLAAVILHGMPNAGARPGRLPSTVVLVSVDTLRADSVSFAGHQSATTPFMDRIARDGVVFTNAYATSSWTPPSVGSLLTGLYPTSHGVTTGDIRIRGKVEQPVLPAALTTLAEAFHSAGYTTIGVPANRHLMASLGFAQGFDHYYRRANFYPAKPLNEEVRRLLKEAFGDGWRDTWKTTKTFLWIHYFDPHDPYFARRPWIDTFDPAYAKDPSDYPEGIVMLEMRKRYPRPDTALGAKIRPLYDSEIAYWDDSFRELAKELGLDSPDVLLAFTSDHGEELAEHGALGHSQSLYEELVHVPMMIRWPAGIKGGRSTPETVSIVDLYPTLVDLAGLKLPAGLQGRTLAPFLRGRTPMEKRPVFMQLMPPKPHQLAVRSGSWKLIAPRNGADSPKLFDLRADPGEHHDVSSANPMVSKQLEEMLVRWFEDLPPSPELRTLALTDKEVEEQLRALGYLE